nr:unnamed protein product [Digitaria exilis]
MRFLRKASCSSPFAFFLVALALVVGSSTGISTGTSGDSNKSTKYNAMFSFGDSVAETGNICVVSSANATEYNVLTCTHRPYGITYFGRPSCRWCDGRIVVDFIDCKEFLAKSLFQFGGFGGNDYNVQLLELGLTIEQTKKNTPMIVNATVNGIEVRLIAHGAVHIVVPGILPTGCLPLFLTLFTDDERDQYGCLKTYNRLTEYHNSMLRKQLQILQGKHRYIAKDSVLPS